MEHDILIYIIVGFILVLQIKAFLGSYLKIKDYKQTMQKSKDFEMVEVYVNENEIDQINVETLVQQAGTPQIESIGVEMKSSGNEFSGIADQEITISEENLVGASEEELPTNQNYWSLSKWLNDKVNSLFEGSLSSKPEENKES